MKHYTVISNGWIYPTAKQHTEDSQGQRHQSEMAILDWNLER